MGWRRLPTRRARREAPGDDETVVRSATRPRTWWAFRRLLRSRAQMIHSGPARALSQVVMPTRRSAREATSPRSCSSAGSGQCSAQSGGGFVRRYRPPAPPGRRWRTDSPRARSRIRPPPRSGRAWRPCSAAQFAWRRDLRGELSHRGEAPVAEEPIQDQHAVEKSAGSGDGGRPARTVPTLAPQHPHQARLARPRLRFQPGSRLRQFCNAGRGLGRAEP